jgi:flagellar biosynthesis component FlhA
VRKAIKNVNQEILVQNNMNIKWLSIASAVLLLLGIPSGWPYAYYTLLRWAITVFTAIVAYNFYKQGKSSWTWVFGGIAVLFNPIAPIYLDKVVWVVIDVVVAGLFFKTAFLKNE